MELEARLVRHVMDTPWEALPREVAQQTKDFILDTLGVLVAGSSAPGCGELVAQIADWNGKGEGTILVFGTRAPAPWAGLANATMAEARDFDDTHDRGIVHTMAPVLSAALAAAEVRGGAPGRDLIGAVALGVDLMARLGVASTTPLTWTRTATLGGMAAAAAGARMLGLHPNQAWDAMGIAYCQAAGNSQTIADGALVKRMQVGFAAHAGLLGLALARRGITGPRGILEGRYGYFRLYEGGNYDRGALTEGLGERFEILHLSAKPYPCARDGHAAIDAALALVREEVLIPEAIEEVIVRGSPVVHAVGGKAYDDMKGNVVVEAILNIPYAVAAVLVRRDLFIGDFEEAAIRDPRVAALARKVRVQIDPCLDARALAPVTVEARLTGGRVVSRRTDVMKGDPRNPLTRQDLLGKFHRCLGYAARPVGRDRAERLIELIDGLDRLPDVRELARLLA